MLAESESRIDDQIFFRNAGHFTGKQAFGQELPDLHQHIVVVHGLLHGARIARHVHQADRHTEFGRGRHRPFMPERGHIIDETCTGGNGRAHHFRLGGIDADRHIAAPGKPFDDRNDTVELFLQRNRRRIRACRFAADVEHVGTLLDQTERMRDGGLRGPEPTAVGEGIRGDIDDGHDFRRVELQGVRAALQAGNGIEHGMLLGGH